MSSRKKTLLINRGIEDGLVIGDHAHFFIPEGIIARGVIIKVSPTRSVWSIYRIVNPEYLKDEEVLNLKITKPMKLSNDPTRQVWQGEKAMTVRAQPHQKVPLAQGASDLDEKELSTDDPELNELLQGQEKINPKKYEIFAGIHFSNQSGKATPDTAGGAEYSGAEQSMQILLGGEFYFIKPNHWLSYLSFGAFVSINGQKAFGQRGSQVGTSFTDLGVTLSLYPFKAKPWHVGKFIPFASFGVAARKASDSFAPGNEVTTTLGGIAGQPDSFSGSGAGTAMFFGLGLKTYLTSTWGMKVFFAYESSSVKYGADTANVVWSRNSSGLKVITAISFRF